MLGALSQLEVSSDIWEQVLQQALDILPELVDEPLAAVMSFVFKAATESQQLLRAVSGLGMHISMWCGVLQCFVVAVVAGVEKS